MSDFRGISYAEQEYERITLANKKQENFKLVARQHNGTYSLVSSGTGLLIGSQTQVRT